MIAVIQRVNSSRVDINSKTIGEIKQGINVLLGIVKDDTTKDVSLLVNKIIHLRIFNDIKGKMNLSLLDIRGHMLIISQFTLAGNVMKGRRPSFDMAMEPGEAKQLYDSFIKESSAHVGVQSGQFAAHMDVYIENSGPVTFILNSREL
ncbi:MAG: D-aminoacyl-tRNA deacylase [Candidatus Margulisbacteria bacterium]|nr:D-aminoacyl-tRNA deacylase [Candidatus Margulisiibacteriota bacterium]